MRLRSWPRQPANCCSSMSRSCAALRLIVTSELRKGWTVNASPKVTSPSRSAPLARQVKPGLRMPPGLVNANCAPPRSAGAVAAR